MSHLQDDSIDPRFPNHIPPGLIIGDSADVLPLSGEVNWGIPTFQVDRLREVADGTGVIVGVVDTGIDHTHPLLASQVLGARDFTGSPNGSLDRHGHGTHCSGTVAASDPRIGMAPGAKLVHGKGLGDSGSGSGTGIAAAIRWCIEQGATIISMSLGSSSQDTTITNEMDRGAQSGIWFVCAAGNSGGGTPDVDWPGRSPSCVSVAALNSNLTPASFTSAGAKIDTAFAGVGIWSCKPGGGFQQMSGTSMATPGVAGVLALYRSALMRRSQPIPSIQELRSLLFSRSTDTHTPGDDNRTGPGWITPLLLALNLIPDPPPVQ